MKKERNKGKEEGKKDKKLQTDEWRDYCTNICRLASIKTIR